MKNIILLIISLVVVGCSAIQLGDAMSSEDYTKKILALGLSHEENLAEASKLETPHLVSVVSLQLTNARDKKIQYEADLIESKSFEDLVKLSNNGSKFIGPKLTESIKTGVLATDSELHTYYLEGTKGNNTDKIQHKLHLTISHNSKNKRDYFSANMCDKWARCEDLKEDGSSNKLEINSLSANASNCSSDSCDYNEVLEVILSEDLLNYSVERGLVIKLISKKKSHKAKISKPYLMGYLAVAK